MKIKPRMTVELKSGSPSMLVTFVTNDEAQVRYKGPTGFINYKYPVECLNIIKDENGHWINTPERTTKEV
jgi:uncharacterized protein YodC (DUF2158 family)